MLEPSEVKGIFYSVLSGLLAATASLLGKFSVTSDETKTLCISFLHYFIPRDEHLGPQTIDKAQYICDNVLLFLRFFCFLLMLACNATMWLVFTKGLQKSATILEPTVYNTATNFFLTAFYSQWCFEENLTVLWWLGTIMSLFGLLLMHQTHQTLVARKAHQD